MSVNICSWCMFVNFRMACIKCHYGFRTFFSSSIVDETDHRTYELLVNEGSLYLYNKTNGQVFKKTDNSKSPWETASFSVVALMPPTV